MTETGHAPTPTSAVPDEVRTAWSALEQAWAPQDPQLLAHMATVRRWLHAGTPVDTPAAASALICVNDDNPAVAVLVYDGQETIVGDALCADCCACSDCDKRGVVLDSEYNEPFCQADADKYTGEETVSGPRIVEIDSDDYRQLIAA